MKDEELQYFTLDEVIRKYKAYNDSLGELEKVIADIYRTGVAPQYAYEVFTGLPRFEPLLIAPSCIADIGIDIVVKSVEEIFHQHLKELTKVWKITRRENEVYRQIIKSINQSSFSQAEWLKGLKNILQALNGIANLKAFYMQHEEEKKVAEAEAAHSVERDADADTGDDEKPDRSNKAHTLRRKVIALCSMLSEMDGDILSDGNKRNVARFIHFLTGNNEDNIYKMVRKLPDMSGDYVQRDFDFVTDEFSKVKLDALASEMEKGERWWM